jgi:superfamily I DNA/RNA helicase
MGKADVAQGIISLITKMNAKDVPELVKAITVWAEVETDKENAKKEPSESKLDRIADRRECVLAFCEDMKTVKEVIDRIEKLFTEVRDAVRLSSIHKAKGLEAKRVFFLAPGGFKPPHPRSQPWERQQELNMRYVGVTRAIEELVYVF